MSRWFDYWIPFLLACLVTILSFKYIPVSGSEGNFQNFMSAFVEFGSLCFGVLLTFFGIVIQSSSDTVRRMKRKTKMFNRFILYNRNIIMFSLALTIYAYIFGNLDFWKETSYCVPPNSNFNILWSICIFYLWLMLPAHNLFLIITAT